MFGTVIFSKRTLRAMMRSLENYSLADSMSKIPGN
jgi:hypothetical protein